jgi:hypothetical protein
VDFEFSVVWLEDDEGNNDGSDSNSSLKFGVEGGCIFGECTTGTFPIFFWFILRVVSCTLLSEQVVSQLT